MENAILSDGTRPYSFLLDPETLQYTYNSTYTNNSVLGTQAPDVGFLASVSTLSIPRILFISQGLVQDVKPMVDALASLSSSGQPLRFSYAGNNIERCFISRFSIVHKHWTGNKLSQAEGTLDLILARPTVVSIGTNVVNSVYTLREQDNISKAVKAGLQNPSKRKLLGILSTGALTINTDAYGMVTINAVGYNKTFKVADLKNKKII
jgi:hypothetical protein